MTVGAVKQIRGYLISSSSVTNLVTSNDIKVGWTKTVDSFPCIIITQSSGMDYGYLGYKTATAGSKIRREDVSIQVDIYSQDSKLNVDEIADEVEKVLISGTCRKSSDVDMYNDELNLYRKVQSYSFTKFHDD